jgi:hypothetical protein
MVMESVRETMKECRWSCVELKHIVWQCKDCACSNVWLRCGFGVLLMKVFILSGNDCGCGFRQVMFGFDSDCSDLVLDE